MLITCYNAVDFFYSEYHSFFANLCLLCFRQEAPGYSRYPGIRFGLVLPVAEEFAPCQHKTDFFFHLLQGSKLYFKYRRSCRSRTPVLRESSFREQTDMTFYEMLGSYQWTPQPFHQKHVHEFKPLVDRNADLESESVKLCEERDSFELESIGYRG